MSTAIALHDMSLARDETGLRQRAVSKSQNKSRTAPEEDPWLNTPHDLESSTLPIDSRSLNPTAIYWVSPHGILSKSITVFDLTKDISAPYTGMTDEYKEEVQKTMKDHSFTPAITCQRTNWIGLKYDIKDDQNNIIANWSHPWTSVGEAVLTFPEDSTHSTHTVSLRNKTWGMRTECFVVNSIPYFWEADSIWHSTNRTLYRIIGSGEAQKKTEIGKFAQKGWGAFVTGGTLVVDERELDGVIACLTLVVVLKKKRQRAAERRNGG